MEDTNAGPSIPLQDNKPPVTTPVNDKKQTGTDRFFEDAKVKTGSFLRWMVKRSEVSIILGMIGFCLSIYILTGHSFPQKNDRPPFRELQIMYGNKDIKAVILSFRTARFDTLQKLNRRLESAVLHLNNPAGKGRLDLTKDSLARSFISLKAMDTELYGIKYLNRDTSLKYFADYFSIDRIGLDTVLKHLDTCVKCEVVIDLKDTCSLLSAHPFHTEIRGHVVSSAPHSFIEFISKYSAFGLWFFMSVAQMTIWFLILALIIGKTNPLGDFRVKYFLWRFLIVSCVIIIFIHFLFGYLKDDLIIRDNFSLQDFTAKMKSYAVFGYILAAFCFALFLYAANLFDIWQAEPQGSLNSLTEKKDDTIVKSNRYIQLESLFENAFLCSSVILSVFVLWAGILFNAINSTEVMRYYEFIAGRPFLNNDFVYLVALFHTLLLLIFYIPIKVKFNSLDVVQTAGSVSNDQNKKLWSFLSDSLPTILVTTSPLITGLLQKLISSFITH